MSNNRRDFSARIKGNLTLVVLVGMVGVFAVIAYLAQAHPRSQTVRVGSPQVSSGGQHLRAPVPPPPTTAPSGVDPRLWSARPVQDMPALAVAGSNPTQSLWALADHGAMAKSLDGGKTWNPIELNTGPLVNDGLGASFSGIDGWLVTGNGLLQSSDGGTTWSSVPHLPSPPGDNVLLAWLQRDGPDNGWGINNLDQLESTTDGGTTWRIVSGPVGQLEGACFPDAQHGLVATDSPTSAVYMTNDGGSTWSEVWSEASAAIRITLDCPSETEATVRLDYAYGGNTAVSKTIGALEGWVGPWITLSGSSNAGTQGTVAGLPDTSASPSNVVLTSAGLVAVGVGVDGTVLATRASVGGGGVGKASQSRLPSIAPSDGEPLRSTGYATGSAFPNASEGYLVAASQESGKIELSVTQDGGATWTSMVSVLPSAS